MGTHISQQEWGFLREIAHCDRKEGAPILTVMLSMSCFTAQVLRKLSQEGRIADLRRPVDEWIANLVEAGFVEDLGDRLHATDLGHDMAARTR